MESGKRGHEGTATLSRQIKREPATIIFYLDSRQSRQLLPGAHEGLTGGQGV